MKEMKTLQVYDEYKTYFNLDNLKQISVDTLIPVAKVIGAATCNEVFSRKMTDFIKKHKTPPLALLNFWFVGEGHHDSSKYDLIGGTKKQRLSFPCIVKSTYVKYCESTTSPPPGCQSRLCCK